MLESSYLSDNEKSFLEDSQFLTRKLPSDNGRNVFSASMRVIEP